MSSHTAFSFPPSPVRSRFNTAYQYPLLSKRLATPLRQHSVLQPTRPPRSNFYCIAGPALPSSVAICKDKVTGANIFVVGCVHGSRVSADDVKLVLDKVSADRVILELCDSRLQSLRNTIEKTSPEKPLSTHLYINRKNPFSYFCNTFGGAGPGAVAFVLEMVYRIQVIAGVDPGIEFAEPIRRYSPANIVCGDAPAKDTVKHIYNVFGAPLKSLADSQKSVSDLVKRVILPPKGGVSIFSLFLKEPARLKELARLILPASALAIGIGLVGNAGAVALESTSVVTGLSHGPSGPLFPLIMAVIQTLVVSYSIASTLKFLKVLISDRDTILAKSILDTAARLQQEQGKPGTVCAVVGLLHVNGILKLLQEHNEKENVLS